MYDTRWPRPGPAMAAVAAVLGLVAGVVLGLSSTGSSPRAAAASPAAPTLHATTTTLPEEFWTVVLGSFNSRAFADDRLRLVRDQGVRDARLLEKGSYNLGTRWAVYSGLFKTKPEAEAHEQQLTQLGVAEHFVKSVKQAG
jgi:SPOR domain